MSHFETVWSFRTRNFIVTFDVAPEDTDPADHFEFPEDIEAVRNGEVEWFCARVTVRFLDADVSEGSIVGADHLGGCAYASVNEFRESHFRLPTNSRNTLAVKATGTVICDYFPSMVREAVANARRHVRYLPRLRTA
jgi:hypothetical protein